MKKKSSDMGEEANANYQSTQSAMLVIPPNISCNLTPEEEDVLAQRIAEHRDEDATTMLYCCCLAGVYYYFYRKTWADIPETENLTHDTWIRAMEGLRNGSWSGKAFRHWLFGIAKNVFREWIRRKLASTVRNGSHSADEKERVKQATPIEQNVQVDLLDNVLMKERGTTLWELVGELSEQDRKILLLRYYYGFRYAEIALQMNCTEQACKTRSWRALEHLREKILQMDLGTELGFGGGN